MKRYYHKFTLVPILLICVFASCKKETTIAVTLFNPALNEFVPNATIVLNEIGSSDCKQIAEATTDANGTAFFNKEKLSKNGQYKLGVKNSWGIAHQNPCSSQTQNYLEIGGTQDIQLSDYIDGKYMMQINNALNPSISGDSLISTVSPMVYFRPCWCYHQQATS